MVSNMGFASLKVADENQLGENFMNSFRNIKISYISQRMFKGSENERLKTEL